MFKSENGRMRKMEQKNRILIVEDDTDINNLLYTALQKAGYETVQAFSGTEARMLFQMDKAGFSLILLDLMLPGIDGYQVCREITIFCINFPIGLQRMRHRLRLLYYIESTFSIETTESFTIGFGNN